MKRLMCLLPCWLILVSACAAPAPAQPARERYVNDLTFIAQAPRPPGSAHHQAVQDLCAKRFKEAGYTVERQTFDTGVNVIGRLEGRTHPTETLIISAHYDSIPDCNGADDNGTGVAALWEVARVLASEKHDRTLVVACWDDEENGLWGARAYAKRARDQHANIVGVIVYDTLGYISDEPNSQQLPLGMEQAYPELVAAAKQSGLRGNFISLLYDEKSRSLADDLVEALQALKVPTLPFEVETRGGVPRDLARSDHYPFWIADYPAVSFSDSGNYRNPGYHCHGRPDDVADLNHDFVLSIVKATVTAARQTLNPASK